MLTLRPGVVFQRSQQRWRKGCKVSLEKISGAGTEKGGRFPGSPWHVHAWVISPSLHAGQPTKCVGFPSATQRQ